MPLARAIAAIPVAAEHEGGYDRKFFKHWNGGVQADDGCDTREELMLAEAVKQAERGEGCKLSGG